MRPSPAGRQLLRSTPLAVRGSVWLLLFGVDGLHGSHADDLDDHLFILRAVPVMKVRRMKHEAAGFHRSGLRGIEDVALAGKPGAFDDGHQPVLVVVMRSA